MATDSTIQHIKASLKQIESSMIDEVEKRSAILGSVHPSQVLGAKNLIHYLTLRKENIMDLQNDLHSMGLSSLASSESHIRSQLQAINQRLGKKYKSEELEACTFEWCKTNHIEKSQALFGEKEIEFLPSIMVPPVHPPALTYRETTHRHALRNLATDGSTITPSEGNVQRGEVQSRDS